MISVKMQRMYFNNMIIKKNWNKIQETPLKRAGLLTRTIMRGSIRRVQPFTKKGRRTRTSKPGKPPHSVRPRGKYDFKAIFSVPMPWASKVIIGHHGFGQPKTPMEIHEFGKTARVREMPQPRKNISPKQKAAARAKFKSGAIKHKPVRFKTIKMPKREFAKPAMKKAKSKLPQFWQNSFSTRTVN